MKPIDRISMTPEQCRALAEIKRRLLRKFDIRALVSYGSHVRGQAEEESDIDLPVVTAQPLTRFERHEITDAAFQVNLQSDTNFSTLVVDLKSWETGLLDTKWGQLHDQLFEDRQEGD
jgi:predicted nucleotidyltransferase